MTEKTPAWNRDDEMKPGRPPRPASEPQGSETSTETKKTGVNPSTGEPQRSPPRPNQSEGDERR